MISLAILEAGEGCRYNRQNPNTEVLMSLSVDQLHSLAHTLIEAEHSLTPIRPLTEQSPGLDEGDAYLIAADVLDHELEHGHRVVGRKVGFTNLRIQRYLGVDSPNFGTLLDDMTVRDGGRLKTSAMIDPKVEPEIAFHLKTELKGPGVTLHDVMEATDYVFPALEIVDSRFEGWKFTMPDATADNACAGMVVIGTSRLAPTALNLAGEQVAIYRNDEQVDRGTSVEVLGNPANAVAWCANKLAELGDELRAGQFVLTGSIAGVTSAQAGDTFRAEFASLGVVSVNFT